jgi:hypothetical protein
MRQQIKNSNGMKKYFYTLGSFVLLSTPMLVLAQAGAGPGAGTPAPANISVKIGNPLNGYNSITAVITAILQNIVMPLAAVFVVLAIIYSGFKYVMAQGNPKEIEEANKGLVAVLIGTAVLLGATGISAALQGTLCHIFTSISCT